VNAGRRFSQAISEGDGISLIARVSAADDAARVEEQGAEGVLVAAGDGGALAQIRGATNLPVLVTWPSQLGEPPPASNRLAGVLGAVQDEHRAR